MTKKIDKALEMMGDNPLYSDLKQSAIKLKRLKRIKRVLDYAVVVVEILLVILFLLVLATY